jgi:glycosyltransferase involved in cell wall biosynthesis
LSGVGSPEYDALLRRALKEAKAVLVLNPTVAEVVRPWCTRVEVVTWGMDPDRFPWPRPRPSAPVIPERPGIVRILFAGVVDEPIKGFSVLHEACRLLWTRRRDFELVVTSKSRGEADEFTRFVGWTSQKSLPDLYAACDICVVPTIAQDGLSRTSVEAMACGIPVIGSRIGGLPYSVEDGVTGLLCEPGSPTDWARQLESLLDSPGLRNELGLAGRREFECRFPWPAVIERDYLPLFKSAQPYRIASE